MTRIRAPQLPLNEESPFDADELARREFADALTDLIRWAPTPCVFNLDAGWGQGKTTFLHMWRASLATSHSRPIYLNAWETDFSEDPLLALLGELDDQLKEDASLNSEVAGKLATLKRVGARLLKAALPIGLKAATMGVVDLSDMTEDAMGEIAEKIADEELKNYEAKRHSIEEFRARLADLAESLQQSQAPEGESSLFPLVVIVDELDRCRPSYAIKVLETIKHLFNVSGVTFLIATDSRQLACSIRHAYGADIDCDGYLRRFFDMTLRLPAPHTAAFVRAQIGRFGLSDFFAKRTHHELQYDKEQVEGAFSALFDATRCSLRDQERCFALLSVALRSTKENQYLHPLLLCTLIVLRVKNESLYSELSKKAATSTEIVSYFSASSEGRRYFEEMGYGQVIEAHLIHVLEDEAAQATYKDAAESKEQSPLSDRARRIIEILGSFSFRRGVPSLKAVIAKIDLVAAATDMH